MSESKRHVGTNIKMRVYHTDMAKFENLQLPEATEL